jgi:inosose dehydratase
VAESPLSRRDFIRAAAVLPIAASLSRAADADPFGGFTVGVQSYTFRKFNLEQMLKRTQEAGLKFAEFYSAHVAPNSNPDKPAATKKLCAEYGITPIAFGVERFSKDHDANKKKFEFLAGLGAKYFTADPDPDSFDSLDKLVDEYKIGIAIHPHGPVNGKLHRWYSAEVILDAVKDHNPQIGTCLDTGHLIRSAQLGKNLDPVAGAADIGIVVVALDERLRNTRHLVASPMGLENGQPVLTFETAFRQVNERGRGGNSREFGAEVTEPD